EALFNAFGSSIVFVPLIGPHGKLEFPDTEDYLLYIKEKRLSDTRLWFILFPEDESFKKQVEIVESMI
ncbi:MAG: hypothetical protein Q7J78_06410, partial [Clostridiales bacterium]|nr:hypothetical protein [Clostridiales bacterium]